MLQVAAARVLSVVGHPALLMPLAVAAAASGPGAPPQLLRVALGTALKLEGFLAPRRRNVKALVLHVTEFEPIAASDRNA